MDERIEIRKATSADKDAVLRIHDHVYDGEDYLPAYYDYFLFKAPQCTPYVLLYDGEIIFYEVYQTVDEGRTVLIRAGRINPKYERKGFVKYFEAWLADWRKENNIEKIAFTASDANPAVTRDTFQLKNKLILTRQMPLYCVDVLATHLPEDQISSAMALESVTDQKLSVYLASNSVQEYLWPERRMIVDMVPLRTIETNITYMRGPEEFTAIFSDIRTENDKCCGLLSFGTVFKVQKHPYHMNLDIFGSDTRTLMEHIVRHLLVLKSKVKGEAAVLAMVQEDYDMEKLDSVFKSFGVERKIWFDSTYPSLRYSKLYLYERDALTS